MKKRILLSCLFWVLLHNAYGQKAPNVIYLKNGSVINGTIVELKPNESAKIKTADGSVIIVKPEEIEKIVENTKSETSKSEPSKNEAPAETIAYKKRGFINITELYTGIHIEENNKDFFAGINTVNGYQFGIMTVGLGLGYERFSSLNSIPVTADLRVCFSTKKTAPYFGLAAGYSFMFVDADGIQNAQNEGGVTFSPHFGVKTFLQPKIAFYASVGYRYQSFYYGATGLSYFGVRTGFSF